MGLWGAVKYALNSTLGTSGFKPLDQLLTDDITAHVENYIGKASNRKGNITAEITKVKGTYSSSHIPQRDFLLHEITNPEGGYLYYFNLHTTNLSLYAGGPTQMNTLSFIVDGEKKYIFNEIKGGYGKNIAFAISDYVNMTTPAYKKLSTVNSHFNLDETTINILYQLSAGTHNIPSQNSDNAFTLLTEPIRFNESLRIQFDTCYFNSDYVDCGLIYSLDE